MRSSKLHKLARLQGVCYYARMMYAYAGVPGVRYAPPVHSAPPPGWLSCREAARLLGCSKGTVRAMLVSVACRTRRGCYYDPEDVLALPHDRPTAPPPGYCASVDAVRVFGVCRSRLSCLAAQGLVRAMPGKGKRGAFCYWYSMEDLHAVCRRGKQGNP